ncbi:hypothetical protein [Paraburkholderia sp. BCC1884]|uniref:hypothetical protein n=1 Tax=Paraburkholderia sp. BCC1884 TaxID=2562668 RepID=UPI0011842C86|nr:hypothetical protein [Paraburkholderia sp. BCC1884]
MKSKLLAALLVAVTASIAAPAFASGYGPAPSYRPSVGAPASQRGQSAQTVAAEQSNAVGSVNDSYGGVVASSSASGRRQSAEGFTRLYNAH